MQEDESIQITILRKTGDPEPAPNVLLEILRKLACKFASDLPYVALLAFCAGRMSNQVSEADPATRQAHQTSFLREAAFSASEFICCQGLITKLFLNLHRRDTAEPFEAKQLAAALRDERIEKDCLATELAKAKQLVSKEKKLR